MDAKMIGRLKQAGVAPDVILDFILEDLEDKQATVQTTPEQVPTPGPPEMEQETANNAVPAASPAAEEKGDAVLAKLDRLIGIVQQRNIMTDGRDSAPQESVDDILAAMITPAKGGKK